MARKLLCGFALMAGLAIAAGCGGSSSAPSISKEELDKKYKQNDEMMKGKMMPPGGAAPVVPPGGTPEKK